MLKPELVTLVNALRAENSTLRTQLAAARSTAAQNPQYTGTFTREAIQRLAARHPARASFTADEVRREVACSG